ncbi:hypothetical protein FNU79_00780 [Deinococcus detaillensis]|uniref:HRDC domain-containing protein n=1 Tax=Deinococcus detaillensis TaxID=2592048 RepID=A0A553V5T1_9DEIO|nr:HRDC domain-containing protein [Deinococcus detaillensis]TSA87822.1 hypothetical protein FNU79_00780 [Deinococcus detaillensis]
MTAVSPDVRLPGLHAEAGDPHTRLSRALADLEGADWGLFLADQAALARQLFAQFGPGTLRVDARLGVSREVFASAGLAVATIDADWRGAVAVWLLEPDERALKRAKRAGVPVLVDATLAPGGGWLGREATLIVYRDAATISGFGDVTASALFGAGSAPPRRAPAPSDLGMAMILRDLATLPLRLARAARTTVSLMERFAGAAQEVGPTALLLAPDSAPDSHAPLGGVLAASRNVGAGTLITPGVQGLDAVLALLRGETQVWDEQSQTNQAPSASSAVSRDDKNEAGATGAALSETRPSETSLPASTAAQPAAQTARPLAPAPEPLSYVPEIVFSDSAPHPEPERRREEVEEHAPELTDADSEAESVSSGAPADLPDTGRRPQRWPKSGRRQEQRSEDWNRSAQSGQPEPEAEQAQGHIQDTASTEEDAAGSAESQPAAELVPEPPALPSESPQPEIVLTPDLPPAESKDPTEGLSDEQRAVFARLRDWRNAEAKRQEISRFIIASNATLAEIARSAPRDETELRKVRGMGPERVRKYGEAILGTVQAD